MTENIVPARPDHPQLPPTVVPDNRARLEVIEATLTIDKAVAAGVVDEARGDSMRRVLVHEIARAVDLTGLEHVDADGKLIGVVVGMERAREEIALFDDIEVRLEPGGLLDRWSLIERTFHDFGYLRLPGSAASGLPAPIQALRSRLEAQPC
jgi:hypothetical protein